jgi:hypothetical protein
VIKGQGYGSNNVFSVMSQEDFDSIFKLKKMVYSNITYYKIIKYNINNYKCL